ncbi:hypothetical protein [Halobaculum lipolyticum]|uniref:Small CPxCG-related zinc finger protein n=1 Tax=Halobaculum lipolyticum TaxID=3032001 RepID=A0ABD5WDP4_9EURY|nr:hypothetical protein [Halobaculum sp. DT31]
MEYAFECECGEQVSDFTRGGDVEVSTVAVCDDCGAAYGLTITTLQRTGE